MLYDSEFTFIFTNVVLNTENTAIQKSDIFLKFKLIFLFKKPKRIDFKNLYFSLQKNNGLSEILFDRSPKHTARTRTSFRHETQGSIHL